MPTHTRNTAPKGALVDTQPRYPNTEHTVVTTAGLLRAAAELIDQGP